MGTLSPSVNLLLVRRLGQSSIGPLPAVRPTFPDRSTIAVYGEGWERSCYAMVRVCARGGTPGAIRLVAVVKRTLDENHLREAVSDYARPLVRYRGRPQAPCTTIDEPVDR